MLLLHNRPGPHLLDQQRLPRQLATLATARRMASSLLSPPVLPLATPLRLLLAQAQPLRRQLFLQLMSLRLGMRLTQLRHAPASLTVRQQLLTLQQALLVASWHPLPPLAPLLLSPCRQLRLQLLLMPLLVPHLLPSRSAKNRPHHILDL